MGKRLMNVNRVLSIHVQGMEYDVNTSDGTNVGFNADSTTRKSIMYTWYAKEEGVYLFSDMADPRSSEEGTNVHGLFGAIIVEPPESKWMDPVTGKKLKSGLFAHIYREFDIDELKENGQICYRLVPKTNFSGTYIMYLYTSRLCLPMRAIEWEFITGVARECHAGLFVPMYPLAPESGWKEVSAHVCWRPLAAFGNVL